MVVVEGSRLNYHNSLNKEISELIQAACLLISWIKHTKKHKQKSLYYSVLGLKNAYSRVFSTVL